MIPLKNLENKGKFTFSELMEKSMYHPAFGFYRFGIADNKDNPIATHPKTASPFFARALLRQLASMWNEMDRPKNFCVVEMGAGEGHLACDLLDQTLKEFPSFYEAVNLVLVELSPEMIKRQKKQIKRNHHKKIEFICGSILDITWQEICGCFISNELFSSLPVHRVKKYEGELNEFYLEVDKDGKIHETMGPLSTPDIEDYFKRQRIHLGEGQEFLVNTQAVKVIKNIGMALKSGYHIAIDFGTTADHLIAEDLSCLYSSKKQLKGVSHLDHFGKGELSSTVDFSSLIFAGVEAGLEKQIFVDEYRFFKYWLGWKKDLDDGYSATEVLDPFFYDGYKVLIQTKNAPGVKM